MVFQYRINDFCYLFEGRLFNPFVKFIFAFMLKCAHYLLTIYSKECIYVFSIEQSKFPREIYIKSLSLYALIFIVLLLHIFLKH